MKSADWLETERPGDSLVPYAQAGATRPDDDNDDILNI